jgi:hypothetical protein
MKSDADPALLQLPDELAATRSNKLHFLLMTTGENGGRDNGGFNPLDILDLLDTLSSLLELLLNVLL